MIAAIAVTSVSCGKKNNAETPVNEAKQEDKIEEKVPEKPKYNDGNEKPIAIMIDNDGRDSWPHSGLQDAYMIYEMYVEGAATRLMALFKNVDTAKIGE